MSGLDEATRGQRLYNIALSVVEAEGRFVTVGLMTFKEYRAGKLSVVLMPGSGQLDIWHRRKVLAFRPPLGVTLYRPGEWEKELEVAAANPLRH